MTQPIMRGVTPEFVRFMAAMHNPFFTRSLYCWADMRRSSDDPLMSEECWIEDAEYCLDRTEAD